MMNGAKKSDSSIVPAKLANKAERSAAESVEGDDGTKRPTCVPRQMGMAQETTQWECCKSASLYPFPMMKKKARRLNKVSWFGFRVRPECNGRRCARRHANQCPRKNT
jgi:hypothetical protein